MESTRSIDMSVRWQGDLAIVDLHGSLTQRGALVFRETIRTLMETGSQRIHLNMADVAAIDSVGIGELLLGRAEAVLWGGNLKLVNLTPAVAAVLQATGLCDIFGVPADEVPAVGTSSAYSWVCFRPGSEYFLG